MAGQNKEKERNELMKEYFCAITDSDVVTFDKMGKVYVDGEELSDQEALNLKNEAEMFKEMRLFKLLFGSLEKQAKKIMFERAESFDDMRNGKMMLYNLSVQREIVNKLASRKEPVTNLLEEEKTI